VTFGESVLLNVNFNLDKPIYLQIIDEIKRSIVRGELALGEKIPSQRELAQQIKVNPNTVQKAYQEMERIRLVETLRGQGTFICNEPKLLTGIREEMAREALEIFINDMKALGFSPKDIREMVESALKTGNRGS
jgi:GntR family transcriptional regulator